MSARGIKARWFGNLSKPEVCMCRCHEPATRMKHIMACCFPPQNEEEQMLLDQYIQQTEGFSQSEENIKALEKLVKERKDNIQKAIDKLEGIKDK
jgi:hypothetical protein